jgi:antitoxin (DNA-binding transcriptional repressor) of toxin-antitoxin stability system
VDGHPVAYEGRRTRSQVRRPLIERVECGEEVIIDRAGTPVAKIVPLVRRVNRAAVGSLAGQLDLSADWDSPQTNTEIAADFGISS